MNLLQNLLMNVKDQLLENAKWVAHNQPSNELLVFGEGKPKDNGSKEMYCSENGPISSLGVTEKYSTDWHTPLEITPRVRKLIDMVLDKNSGWVVYTGGAVSIGYYDVFCGNEIFDDVDQSIVEDSETILYRPHQETSVSSPEEERSFQQTEAKQPKVNTYSRELTNRMKLKSSFDAYDIGTAFELDPMRWAAVKKIIGAGSRNGKKPVKQDIEEAIESLNEFLLEKSNDS